VRRSAWKPILVALFAIVAAEACLQLLWPILDDNDPVPGIESQLAVLAAVALAVLPHVIALLARRRRWLFQAQAPSALH
jgi:uncharacterized membrane protein YdfJ with MMPL/SSD domain